MGAKAAAAPPAPRAGEPWPAARRLADPGEPDEALEWTEQRTWLCLASTGHLARFGNEAWWMSDDVLRNLPDPDRVRALLSSYAPVRVQAETGHLSAGDRRAVVKLIEAASHINRIYWRQRSELGWTLKTALGKRHDPAARELERLLTLNFGPWNHLENDAPFWGQWQRPQGGSLYPEDLTREELDIYASRHPEERSALLGHKTLIRRRGDALVPIRYEDAYRDELAAVARALTEASEVASHDGFRRFLRARADGLVSGDLYPSEVLWLDVADSPIDIAIGPYEVYDDGLLGVKTSYEATVLVRHPSSETIAAFESVAPELERELPGAVEMDRSHRRIRIGVYDVAFAAGMTNMGSKAIAAMLPNDERVRAELGGRLLLFNNVIAAKFAAILEPVAARVFVPQQRSLVREDAFVIHTLLHETAHALGSCYVRRDGPTKQTINDLLRERYSAIEEARADILGLSFLVLLTQHRVFPAEVLEPAAVTFVASGVRSLRFGIGSEYAKSAAIALTRLVRDDAIVARAEKHLEVRPEVVHQSMRNLGSEIQRIATYGDYDAAGKLIEELGSIPREIGAALDLIGNVPVDIEFVFNGSTAGAD